MSKETVTRRQKDISRLLREKSRIHKSVTKKMRKSKTRKNSDS